MGKYEEKRGFIRGISDEEFDILLKLAFTRNRFQIEKIKRDVMIANDFLITLTRIEKKGLFRRKKKFLRKQKFVKKSKNFAKKSKISKISKFSKF